MLSGVTNQPFVLCTCVGRCDQSTICPVYLCCQVWPIKYLLCVPVLSGVSCVSVLSCVTKQPFVLYICVVRCDQSTILSCVPVLSGVTNQPFVLCTFVVMCVLCVCVVRCDQSTIYPVYLCCQVCPISHLSCVPLLSGVSCVCVLSGVTNQPFVLCTCVVRCVLCTCVVRCDQSTICTVYLCCQV